MKVNVEPTAKIIDDMAVAADDLAGELRRHAESMRKQQSFEYAPEVLNSISNFHMRLRTDLIVRRPLREYEKNEL